MRGRIHFGVIVSVSLLVSLLAGCLAPEDPEDAAGELAVLEFLDRVPPGQYESHPAFGFPTNGMLPVSGDGETRKVLPDGKIQWYRPAGRALPAAIEGIEAVTHVEGTSTGGGIAVFGPLAFIGHRVDGPLQVIDISDPRSPVQLGEAAEVPVRDADPIHYPDGRLVVVTTAGSGEQYVTDVSDPAAPSLLAAVSTDHGNHNIAVVPGTPVVYNSGSNGVIDIVDYSDPEDPVEGSFDNGQGCHDITFHIDNEAGRYRAYCAGYGQTQIWDIADPLDPQMVKRIPYPGMEQGLPLVGDATVPDSGAVFPLSFSHLAMVDHDASVLIVGDETGGGAINGCDFYAEAMGGSLSGPVGNLWFYDISDEAQPELLGHVSPSYTDAVGGSCTAHFGRLVEDTGLLVMGFYAAGVVLVDFTDPSEPLIRDRFDTEGSIWDVWYHQGYLFTGDMSRGMDVLELV